MEVTLTRLQIATGEAGSATRTVLKSGVAGLVELRRLKCLRRMNLRSLELCRIITEILLILLPVPIISGEHNRGISRHSRLSNLQFL